MKSTLDLPVPTLAEGRFASISLYTDEALFAQTGIRIGFTTRHGGVSEGSYDSLNLGSHVNDDVACVEKNRTLLKKALGVPSAGLVVPNQVHGDVSYLIDSPDLHQAQQEANEGVDALILAVPQVMGLLCFADCVPVIIVLPTGLVAVIHAGWRGVENCISAKTLTRMLDWEWEKHKDTHASIPAEKFKAVLASGANVYIGPHIQGECFETSE
ncbi:MAG: polyphenol oxidase family protein, partial [Anaerotardibacter sp.]